MSTKPTWEQEWEKEVARRNAELARREKEKEAPEGPREVNDEPPV
jgi:hypothetical protein